MPYDLSKWLRSPSVISFRAPTGFFCCKASITHNVTWEEKSTQNKKEKEIDGLNRRKFEVGTRQIGL